MCIYVVFLRYNANTVLLPNTLRVLLRTVCSGFYIFKQYILYCCITRSFVGTTIRKLYKAGDSKLYVYRCIGMERMLMESMYKIYINKPYVIINKSKK